MEENNKNEMIESYGIQIMSPLLTNGSTEQDMLWALRNLSDKDWIEHFKRTASKVDGQGWTGRIKWKDQNGRSTKVGGPLLYF